MARYVKAKHTARKGPPPTRSWSTETWYEDDYGGSIGQPMCQDDPPIDTGLVTADGEKLYRVPERIGFIWSAEEPDPDYYVSISEDEEE